MVTDLSTLAAELLLFQLLYSASYTASRAI